MEPKKTIKADLRRKTFLFFNVGLIVSLTTIILAFTHKSMEETGDYDLTSNPSVVDEELLNIPVTDHQLPPAPGHRIIEVKNDAKIIDEIPVFDDLLPDEVTPEIVITPDVTIAPEDTDTPFIVVEEGASPEGGMPAFYQFIAEKIKYPFQAKRNGIDGKVFVEFIVERDGALTNVKTIRGIGAGCDEEAERVVKAAAKWNAGKQRGKPVRQKLVIPIVFQLN